MNYENIKTNKKLSFKDITSKLANVPYKLEQDTKDIVQLNPVERMNSISKVWDTCKNEVGRPESAFDVGSGFGYGMVFLETQGIKTIGIENVEKKLNRVKNCLI